MKKQKLYKCLSCKGDKELRVLSPYGGGGGTIIISTCQGCNGTGRITKKVFLFQVKRGFTSMSNLEIVEFFNDITP